MEGEVSVVVSRLEAKQNAMVRLETRIDEVEKRCGSVLVQPLVQASVFAAFWITTLHLSVVFLEAILSKPDHLRLRVLTSLLAASTRSLA